MKYKNAKRVLPESLIEQIQQYVQGEYIYIPSKKEGPRPLTDYGIETRKRDEHIYTKHLEWMKYIEVKQIYAKKQHNVISFVYSKSVTVIYFQGLIWYNHYRTSSQPRRLYAKFNPFDVYNRRRNHES